MTVFVHNIVRLINMKISIRWLVCWAGLGWFGWLTLPKEGVRVAVILLFYVYKYILRYIDGFAI